jgi:maltose/moltooligosaccharide transporter
MTTKPQVTFWQIWNMCFGFLGIQFGFALQNANVSRIFQTLGAQVDEIPILWIAAPLTGLIVQPIVGYYSDRTWNGLGRRRPYFLAGAVLTTLALFAMPNSPSLWIAAGLLWILDASLNISMEPFRAFVGDQLSPKQRPTGYAMQSFFIGIGAVVASLLPWLLATAGVQNSAEPGGIPDTVKYAVNASKARRDGLLWLVAGVVAVAVISIAKLEKELYLLAAGLLAYGIALLILSVWRTRNAFVAIMADLHEMPPAMRRLAVVQFFSWFALFAMWIYTTAAVTQVHYGTTDPQSAIYNEGANWVGVLFASYSGFAAIAAIVIPLLVRRFGLRVSHLINLWLGAAGLVSFALIRDPHWLIAAMVGVGFAWASIVSLPYALLSNNLPAAKMGVYMGIFNFFIVIPQLLAASVLGFLLRAFAQGQPIYALVIGGASLFIAGLATLRVAEPVAELAFEGQG